jgi:hypothetical protein
MFRQWKTRTQRYILQKKLIVWEGVLITKCQQDQHSDNMHCMLDTCNAWFRPHKNMDSQVRPFQTLIFCSSFSWSRHPYTMFRQISLKQTWPQNCATDGLPRTQLTAFLSNFISQDTKSAILLIKCRKMFRVTLHWNCNSNYKYITKILLNLQDMKYEAAVNILLKCCILANNWLPVVVTSHTN